MSGTRLPLPEDQSAPGVRKLMLFGELQELGDEYRRRAVTLRDSDRLRDTEESPFENAEWGAIVAAFSNEARIPAAKSQTPARTALIAAAGVSQLAGVARW